MAGVCVKDTQGFRFGLEFMSWKSQEEIIIGTQWLGGFSNGKNKRLMIQNTCIQVKKFKKTCFCWKAISLNPKSRKAKLLLNCERRKEKWAFPAFLFGKNLFLLWLKRFEIFKMMQLLWGEKNHACSIPILLCLGIKLSLLPFVRIHHQRVPLMPGCISCKTN